MPLQSYSTRLGTLAGCNLICAFYVARVVRRGKPGWARLALSVPVVIYNCLVGFAFDVETETITKGVFLLCCFWISNFKLLALCLNRGSLTRSWTYAQFASLYLAPITPQDEVPGKQHVWIHIFAVNCLNCKCATPTKECCLQGETKAPAKIPQSELAAEQLGLPCTFLSRVPYWLLSHTYSPCLGLATASLSSPPISCMVSLVLMQSMCCLP